MMAPPFVRRLWGSSMSTTCSRQLRSRQHMVCRKRKSFTRSNTSHQFVDVLKKSIRLKEQRKKSLQLSTTHTPPIHSRNSIKHSPRNTKSACLAILAADATSGSAPPWDVLLSNIVIRLFSRTKTPTTKTLKRFYEKCVLACRKTHP